MVERPRTKYPKHQNTGEVKESTKMPFEHPTTMLKTWLLFGYIVCYNIKREKNKLFLCIFSSLPSCSMIYVCILSTQCSKLRFYFVRHLGALVHKTCTRQLVHALPLYIAIIIHWKNVHTPGAQSRKTCARRRKCAPRAQCAPLISNTATVYLIVLFSFDYILNVLHAYVLL